MRSIDVVSYGTLMVSIDAVSYYMFSIVLIRNTINIKHEKPIENKTENMKTVHLSNGSNGFPIDEPMRLYVCMPPVAGLCLYAACGWPTYARVLFCCLK